MSTTLKTGTRLGKYEVESLIAVGGMGSVYKARDPELGRTVAVKVLPSHLARMPALLERFRREARHAARLNHPHIVTLHECGHDPDTNLHYLVMEYIDGIDLGVYIHRKGKLPPEEARRILIQAVRALRHAFEQGVIHRDIKPSNFLLARVGDKIVVKMTDLGLARVENDDDYKVTREGTTVGTVDYLSPEQARDSRAADIRSDMYSLGCTAYHMLAGRPPFAEGGLGERVYKHLAVPPPDVRQLNPEVSAGFWAVLQKMLAKDPEDRYATPAELLHDLKRVPGTAAAEDATNPTRLEGRSKRKTKHVPAPAGAPAAEPEEDAEESQLSPVPDGPTPVTDSPAGQLTPEQARAAAAFHERAVEVLAEGGGDDYARQLLGNCLKLDPFNATYRRTLREVNQKAAGGTLGRWLGSLNVMALKSKLRAARAGGDWRKALEHGEEILARYPADADTHIEMAATVEGLGLSDLALWFLEQGRGQAPDNTHLIRAQARLCEQRRDFKRAVALWEHVSQMEPNDLEAVGKINELSVKDHIAKTKSRRR